MEHLWDYRSWLHDDAWVGVVQIRANDPRTVPTEGIVVVFRTENTSLADLESLTPALREQCNGWGTGYIEELSKTSGGIGASGLETLSLFLGVVGVVPTVAMIMDKLNLRRPRLCPDRDVAWDTATWAVALQYETVSRKNLGPHSETRASDHYEFEMLLDHSPDQFIVKVFGDPKGEAIATQVMWVNGDPVNFVKPGARRQIGRADTINLQKDTR